MTTTTDRPLGPLCGDTADIFDYENGDLSAGETVMLFASLVRSGLAWSLQGHYGRTAEILIAQGWLDHSGNVLRSLDDLTDEFPA